MQTNDQNKGIIRIRRKLQYAGVAISFIVLVDNREVGRLSNNGQLTFALPPGTYLIGIQQHGLLGVGGNRSNVLQAKIEAGKTYDLVCYWKIGGLTNQVALEADPLSGIFDAAPAAGGIPASPTMTAASPQVTVHLSDDVERRQAAVEKVNVPAGVRITVRRSYTIEHSVEFEWGQTGSLNVNAGLLKVIGVSIQGEIERQQRRTYQERETIEYEVALDGSVSRQYELIWTDIWRKGLVETPLNGSTQMLPFLFRERTELDVVPRE